MSIEMELRLQAEWRARVEPVTRPAAGWGARRALPAAELAALDADLAARGNATLESPTQQAATIGDLARALGGYARISGYAGRPMTEHEHRLAWERETRR